MTTKDVDRLIEEAKISGGWGGQITTWYGFTVFCDLYTCSHSNMVARSKQNYCKRKDRSGKERESYERLHCNWRVCPKLKDIIKK